MNDLSSLIELNDSEIEKVEVAVNALIERQWKHGVNLEAFRREAIERVAEVGFKLNVEVWTTNQEGLYAFDLIIVDRLSGEFDPDKQVHEVTNDLLGLNEGGVIKTKGGLHLLPGGSHGHGHSHGPGGHSHN